MGRETTGSNGRVVLLLGGARSGKSAVAEKMASRYKAVAYIATAEAIDEEMRERIKAHREARPKEWKTFEVDGSMAAMIDVALSHGEAVIVDCLTVYVARRMERNSRDDKIISEVADVVKAAKSSAKTVIIVSNEVGLGLVPEHPVGRRYRDLLGKVNQKVAELADHVYLMIAGIPVDIKTLGGTKAFD